jgi:hypothetical protein
MQQKPIITSIESIICFLLFFENYIKRIYQTNRRNLAILFYNVLYKYYNCSRRRSSDTYLKEKIIKKIKQKYWISRRKIFTVSFLSFQIKRLSKYNPIKQAFYSSNCFCRSIGILSRSKINGKQVRKAVCWKLWRLFAFETISKIIIVFYKILLQFKTKHWSIITFF